jgi:hypothetical protein
MARRETSRRRLRFALDSNGAEQVLVPSVQNVWRISSVTDLNMYLKLLSTPETTFSLANEPEQEVAAKAEPRSNGF